MIVERAGVGVSGRSGSGRLQSMPWFAPADLTAFGYEQVDNAGGDYLTDVVIPQAEAIVQSRAGWTWTNASVPSDVVLVAKQVAVRIVLAGVENIATARARGQSTFTVAGDQVVLSGPERLLSESDAAILDAWRARRSAVYHLGDDDDDDDGLGS